MKKALFGLFLVVVVVALLLVAMVACEDQEIAYAVVTSVSSTLPNGVVTPNILPYCDYRDAILVTQAPTVNSDPGIYYTAGTFGINDVYPSVQNSKLIASTGSYVYFVFDCPSADSVKFHFSAKRLSGSNYLDFTLSDGVNYVTDNGTGIGVITTGLRSLSYTINPSYTGKRLLITLGATYETEFYNVKLASGFQASGGFVVPEVLSSSDDSFDYYNNGVVAPNLLNNSDLYEVPFYTGYVSGDDVYTDSYLNGAGMQDIWYTSIASSSFTYNTTNKCVTFPLGFVGDALRYDYSSFDSPSVYTFSLAYVSPIDLTFSVTDDSYESLYDEVIPSTDSSPSVFTYTFDLTEYEGDSFSIFISTEVSDAVSMSIYYTKLEYGEHFTGYIYPDRDLSDVVRTNLLYDWTFEEAPDADHTSYQTWLINSSDVVSTALSPAGRSFEASTSSYVLSYRLNQEDFTQYLNYTFALRVVTSKPLVIQTKAYSIFTAGYWVLESPSPVDISFTFEYRNDTVIEIVVEEGTEFSLYYAKLEQGSNFTGFCENSSVIYDDGYNSGYDVGFTEGVISYANTVHHLAFNDVESPNRVNEGWQTWGFSSGVDFYSNAYFELYSYFYQDKGFSVVWTDYYYDPESAALNIIISRDNVNIDTFDSNSNNYVNLLVFATYSNLYMRDSEYPSNWNPVVNPNTRVVDLRVTRLDDFVEKYGESIRSVAYGEGEVAGYQRGVVDGIAQGLEKYQNLFKDVGNSGWLSFFYAFVDVPVMVITSLLDYDVFGFNMLSILKTIILFSVVWLTIRLLTKGKVVEK